MCVNLWKKGARNNDLRLLGLAASATPSFLMMSNSNFLCIVVYSHYVIQQSRSYSGL